MTRQLQTGLLAGASALVLGLALAPAPAHAFKEVKWKWDAHVHTWVKEYVDIDVYVDPSGMVMVEDLQVFVGDVKAASYVDDIENHQPDTGKKWGHFDFGKKWGGHKDPVSYNALTELPEVISSATAVANNTAIESEVHVNLHEKQVVVGDKGGYPTNLSSSGFGYYGGIPTAEIEAISDVENILNASVDSSATAVANNMTLEVKAATNDDGVVIGDIQQWAFADVTATSKVDDVDVYSYTNLGKLDRPLVSSVATAIGNNKSIVVKVPAVQ
jgi:hypothetical protein